jgi:predicted SAM-dependent methyltransferase
VTIKANCFRLNLGCGPHYAAGWVNIDRYRNDEVPDGRRVDLVCDVMQMPYDDNSCSHVYMGHLIEHLSLEDEVPRALAEIRRVLTPEGQLMVVGPDIARAEAAWPDMVPAIAPGEGDDKLPPGIPHKWAPTEATVLAACTPIFAQARAVAIDTVGDPWPLVDPVGWQFAIYCPV